MDEQYPKSSHYYTDFYVTPLPAERTFQDYLRAVSWDMNTGVSS